MKLNKIVTVVAGLLLVSVRIWAMYDAGMGRLCPASPPVGTRAIDWDARDTHAPFEFSACLGNRQHVLFRGVDTGHTIPCGDFLTNFLRPLTCFVLTCTIEAFQHVLLQVVGVFLILVTLGLSIHGFHKRVCFLAVSLIPFHSDLTTSPTYLAALLAFFVIGDFLAIQTGLNQFVASRPPATVPRHPLSTQ